MVPAYTISECVEPLLLSASFPHGAVEQLRVRPDVRPDLAQSVVIAGGAVGMCTTVSIATCL